jgi:hypothetical protein
MPRFLGHYVRDRHLLPLEQGIRKMTSLPAQRERLRDRGLLKEGYFADITVFDAATIEDAGTYAEPAQLSKGVKCVCCGDPGGSKALPLSPESLLPLRGSFHARSVVRKRPSISRETPNFSLSAGFI